MRVCTSGLRCAGELEACAAKTSRLRSSLPRAVSETGGGGKRNRHLFSRAPWHESGAGVLFSPGEAGVRLAGEGPVGRSDGPTGSSRYPALAAVSLHQLENPKTDPGGATATSCRQ
jgi:hypothetical protein